MKTRAFLIVLFLILAFSSWSFAICKGKFFNPVTDIAWLNLFPIYVGGIKIYDSDIPDSGKDLPPICVCRTDGGFRIGVTMSFWEPFGFLEAVFDQGCFPSLGINLNGIANAIGGKREGGIQARDTGKADNPAYFAQTHWIRFPLLGVLNILTDVSCVDEHFDFDSPWDMAEILHITEVDPAWQDDAIALFLSPEALLFANPLLNMACMADAAKAAFGLPIDTLFWCMGSWDFAYPFSGTNSLDSIAVGAATAVSRFLYRLHRLAVMRDAADDPCHDVIKQIWTKSHYRLQPMRPSVMSGGSIRIGQPASTWTHRISTVRMKGQGNWSFVLWRKVTCCLGLNPLDRIQ